MNVLILEDMKPKRLTIIDQITTWFKDDVSEKDIWPAENLEEAKTFLNENNEIRIAIVDVFLGNASPDGIKAAEKMARKGVQVIIHSAHDVEKYKEWLEKLRAFGVRCVPKSAPPNELKKAFADAIFDVKRAEQAAAGNAVDRDFYGITGTGLAIHVMLKPLSSFRDRTPYQSAINRQQLFDGIQLAQNVIRAQGGMALTQIGTTLTSVFPDDTEGPGLTKALSALRLFFESIRSNPNLALGQPLHFTHAVRTAVQPGQYETMIVSDIPGAQHCLMGDRAQVLLQLAINARDQSTGTIDDWCSAAEIAQLNAYGTQVGENTSFMVREVDVSIHQDPQIVCRRPR